MFGNIGVMKRILLLILTTSLCCCGNYVGWGGEPKDDLEEYLKKQDRTVYRELSIEDIIDIVDGVMYDVDDSWPGKWSNDCYERMGWLDVVFIDDISDLCPDDTPNCVGVIQKYKWTITILDGGRDLLSQYETLGHEYTHHVGDCLYLDEDGDHDRLDFWQKLDPENSIEARINEVIWQLTR